MSNFSRLEKFFSKNDPQDPRLGDFAKSFSENVDLKNSVVIVGYPDDEGIANNGGRVGAKEGPQRVREFFYKMTPHLLKSVNPMIIDCGDLKLDSTLEERHINAQENLQKVLKTTRAITIGGGHDYGYPDGAAFLETFGVKNDRDPKPLVINFDAHLDVRPMKDKITSGTPFYRLLKKYNEFEFVEVGIQSQCNSRYHMEWAQEKKVSVLSYDEIQYSAESQAESILRFLEPFLLKKRACFISVDIDGFSSSYAPGCSQSFATGFDPENFFKVFKVLCERLDVKLLGIYEVSPPLDTDNRTSKLAAQIMFESL